MAIKLTLFSSRAPWYTIFGLPLVLPMSVLAFCSSPIAVHMSSLENEGYLRNSACACMASISSLEDTNMEDDLTKYEFGLRLKEVRDYYRETDEMSQENLCLSLFRTRLPNLRLNRCFVGAESTIVGAGRGLFASRDIEEGELITLYPGDVMLAWETTVGDFAGEVGVMFGNHVQKNDQKSIADRLTTDSARAYELKIGGRHSVVADPFLVDDAAYLGHIANDAEILRSRDATSVSTYVESSEKGHNAAHFVLEGSHFVTVATRNIGEGKEIFVSYGYGYWFSRSLQKEKGRSTTTATRLEPSFTSSKVNNKRVKRKEEKISAKKTDRKKGFGKK